MEYSPDYCSDKWPRTQLSGMWKQVKALARGMRDLALVEVGLLRDSFWFWRRAYSFLSDQICLATSS
jgi:hypothetical protein